MKLDELIPKVLIGVARLRASNPSESDEIAQVARIKAWKVLESFPCLDPDDLIPLAIVSARREALTFLRENRAVRIAESSQRAMGDIPGECSIESISPPVTKFEPFDFDTWCFENELSDEEGIIVKLLYQGWSQADIARKFGVGPVQMHRKIKRVRDKIHAKHLL
jgi:DNA-directed RNA polymerase specialized sigma24 family protein